MLCAPVFISTSSSSTLLGRWSCCGLSIWLSLLDILNTLFCFTTKWTKHENLVWYENGRRRLLARDASIGPLWCQFWRGYHLRYESQNVKLYHLFCSSPLILSLPKATIRRNLKVWPLKLKLSMSTFYCWRFTLLLNTVHLCFANFMFIIWSQKHGMTL